MKNLDLNNCGVQEINAKEEIMVSGGGACSSFFGKLGIWWETGIW